MKNLKFKVFYFKAFENVTLKWKKNGKFKIFEFWKMFWFYSNTKCNFKVKKMGNYIFFCDYKALEIFVLKLRK